MGSLLQKPWNLKLRTRKGYIYDHEVVILLMETLKWKCMRDGWRRVT